MPYSAQYTKIKNTRLDSVRKCKQTDNAQATLQRRMHETNVNAISGQTTFKSQNSQVSTGMSWGHIDTLDTFPQSNWSSNFLILNAITGGFNSFMIISVKKIPSSFLFPWPLSRKVLKWSVHSAGLCHQRGGCLLLETDYCWKLRYRRLTWMFHYSVYCIVSWLYHSRVVFDHMNAKKF